MNVLQDIYFVTSCLGFAYVLGSAVIGGMHGHKLHEGHSHTHCGGSQHSGSGHAGLKSGPPPHASGSHGAHNSSGHGTHSASHHQSGPSSHSGARAKLSIHSSDSPSHDAKPTHGLDKQNLADQNSKNLSVSQAGRSYSSPQVSPLYLKILDLLSPTKLACFAFLFGAIGFLSAKILPGYLSLVPAVFLSWFLSRLMFEFMGAFLSSMYSSTNFRKESLVGALGELTVSIEKGSIGEVLVSTGNSRYTSRAKCLGQDETIKKLTRVIVIDIKDDIFIVEPFEDSLMSVDKESS